MATESQLAGATLSPSPFPTRSPVKPERDYALEGLRGLAALIVLYAHVGAALTQRWGELTPWLWPAEPTAAVMVFFVLSGYVIGLTTSGPADASRVAGFAWRRVVRLAPINFAGVLLGCAAADALDLGTVVGNLVGLQNFADYGGFQVPVLETNANLWSLNYELVYYLLFALMWLGGISSWRVGGIALVVGGIFWFGPPSGVFIACYAFGLLFWIGGLVLAQSGRVADSERTNWPTWVLLALVTWKLQALREVVLSLNVSKPYFAGPVVRLYYLDFLPVSLVLVAAIARCQLSGQRWLRAAALLVPVVALSIRMVREGDAPSAETGLLAAMLLLALSIWRWRPGLELFRRLAPVGMISYALYATARPIQEMVFRRIEISNSSAETVVLATVAVVAASFALAWFLERRVQPELHRLLIRPKAR